MQRMQGRPCGAVDPAAPTQSFPSTHSRVIAIAAADDPRLRPDAELPRGAIRAPGRDVLTTVPQGRWRFFSGASFAAAHATGVVALLLEKKPDRKWRSSSSVARAARPARRADGGVAARWRRGAGTAGRPARLRRRRRSISAEHAPPQRLLNCARVCEAWSSRRHRCSWGRSTRKSLAASQRCPTTASAASRSPITPCVASHARVRSRNGSFRQRVRVERGFW